MRDFFRDELAKLSDRLKVNTISYVLDYVIGGALDGTIIQGPQVTQAGGAAVPTPAGPWVALVNRGEDDFNDITIGSQVQINLDPNGGGTWTTINSYVSGTGTVVISGTQKFAVYLTNGPLQIYSPSSAIVPNIRFVYYEKDKIEGGFDNYKDNYTISIQQNSGSKTLDETSDYYNTCLLYTSPSPRD